MTDFRSSFAILIKTGLFLFLLSAFTTNTSAGEFTSFHIYHDAEGEHDAKGVALTLSQWSGRQMPLVTFGLSANTITSNLALEHSNRHEIYPVYMFSNISLNYVISPFLEFGVDLGDTLLDKMFDGDGSDIDVYYSYGFRLTIDRTIGVSIYHKTYDLYFNELDDPALQNVTLDVSGVNISYYF